MSEVKRHYIVDESLGGIEREFVEVERKANVGDYVYVFGHVAEIANGIFNVTRSRGNGNHINYFVKGVEYGTPYKYGTTYKTLSPTNIIRHHGQRYEMVDRKAEVGEKVIITEPSYSKLGAIRTVKEYDCEGDLRFKDDDSHYARPGSYRVLLPLEDSAQSPQSTDDIIANLVARLSKAERKIDELESQNHVNSAEIHNLARENEMQAELISTNTDNIRTWAEDYSEFKAEKESESVFNTSALSTFSLSDLNGKTLKIYTATDTDGNVSVSTTVGLDESDGKLYVLETKTEVSL